MTGAPERLHFNFNLGVEDGKWQPGRGPPVARPRKAPLHVQWAYLPPSRTPGEFRGKNQPGSLNELGKR